jgi:hypothetical protein
MLNVETVTDPMKESTESNAKSIPVHPMSAYTIEVAGRPVATVEATSILDTTKFLLDDFAEEQLISFGAWDGKQPLSIREATWIEKDAFAALHEDILLSDYPVYWLVEAF